MILVFGWICLRTGKNSLLINDLLQKIVEDSDMILYSDIIFEELKAQGYDYKEIVMLLYPLKKIFLYKNATVKQIGKAKDLAEKRNPLKNRDYGSDKMNKEREAEMIQLVIARLMSMPDNIQMHIGNNDQAVDKEQLIEHVKKQDDIGKMFFHLQMEYIKATIRGFTDAQ